MFMENRKALPWHRSMVPALALAVLNPLLLAGSGSASPSFVPEGPKVLTASIYSQGGGSQHLLYRFKRVAEQSGPTLKVLREYTYPDGRLAARERAIYSGDSLRTYELEELQTGGAGSARIEADPKNPARLTITFQYAATPSSRARSESRHEPLSENTLVNDMVGSFLASHWEQLRTGQAVRCQYVVVPRRETLGFSFKKDSECKWRGKDVLVLKMRPTNPFISALVDPLYFTVEEAPPHRVLQYAGRTTPKILEGNRWRDLDAVTVFDW